MRGYEIRRKRKTDGTERSGVSVRVTANGSPNGRKQPFRTVLAKKREIRTISNKSVTAREEKRRSNE